MSNRGMLPKFRPLSEGREGPARPAIRPVKPSPPPPPPTPLRRTSEIRSSRPPRPPERPSFRELVDSDNDTTDRDPRKNYDEPPTLDGGLATSPIRSTGPSLQGMRDDLDLSFDEETQARPIDDGLLSRTRDDLPSLDAALTSLPSLEVRAPFDSYEAEFAERDPVTLSAQHAGHARNAGDSSRRLADSADSSESSYEPYPAPPRSYQEATPRTQRLNEGSGPRERPSQRPSQEPPRPRTASYAAPVPAFDDISESSQWARMPAARAPQDMRQSYPPPPAPHAQAAHYSQPPQPMHLTPPPEAWQQRAPLHPQHNVMTAPMQAAPYHPALSSPAAPVSPSMILQQQPMAPAGATGPYAQMATGRAFIAPMQADTQKPSRFAWFVAGAAFGVAFAFFATGVFSGKRPHEEAASAPAATHVPAQVTGQTAIPVPVQVAVPVSTVVQAPVAPIAQPVAQPIAQPVVVAPPVQTAQPVQAVAPRVAPPAMVEPAVPAQPAATHASPAPRPAAAPAPRSTAVARRPAAPSAPAANAPSVPKPIQGADIDPAPSGGSDFSDLLGAALKP